MSSYPPGCSGTPYDEIADERFCLNCGFDMDDIDNPQSWGHLGFCGPVCCLQTHFNNMRFSDDGAGKIVRGEVWRAIEELQAFGTSETDRLERENAELRKALVGLLSDGGAIRRQINGALKQAVDAHGPIKKEFISSATKRIYCALKQYRKERTKNLKEELNNGPRNP